MSMGSYSILSKVNGWNINLDKVMGSGAWSTVYPASRTTNKGDIEKAAVKVIDKTRLKAHEKQFAALEMDCLRRLEKTPGVLRFLDHFEDSIHHYIFMQLCPHGDLFEYLADKGKLAGPTARYIFAQLLTAVQGIHSQGILHRDLKLENILITEITTAGPTVVICDFGLATIVPSWDVKFEAWVGSPEYASPELINKVPYSAEVDVWALGVILYAMTVGKHPFSDDDVANIYHRIRVQPVYLPAIISDNLGDLITRMLDKNNASRIKLNEITNHPFLKSRPSKRAHR